MFTLIFLHSVSYKTITIFSVKLYSKVPSGNISSGKKVRIVQETSELQGEVRIESLYHNSERNVRLLTKKSELREK